VNPVTNTNTAPAARLITADAAARKTGMSKRSWLRLCDAGGAPAGVKLGHLRRWDTVELDRWINNGCPRIRSQRW
jgi:predicted DNA-binding transcriptional regulator AlpA